MIDIFDTEEKCLVEDWGQNWKWEKYVHLVFMLYNLMGEICPLDEYGIKSEVRNMSLS